MSRFAILAALFMSAAACAAASEPPAAPASNDAPEIAAYAPAAHGLSCEIDVTRINGGVRLEAQAFDLASGPGTLEYDFVVTKYGAAGSSDIVQGGEVSAQTLGEVELSLERGARYRARLTLSDADGEVCTQEVRS
ncbi:MAG: hypothetical protein H7124_17045 [Phycisphaerales bacterium]|nr:hypothetical protein [Hyphomonadaceae bacterium]